MRWDEDFFAAPKLEGNCTLWLFNIAMENGPCIDGLPIKSINSMVIFHGYVSHNQMVDGFFFLFRSLNESQSQSHFFSDHQSGRLERLVRFILKMSASSWGCKTAFKNIREFPQSSILSKRTGLRFIIGAADNMIDDS
jgi:hypothetical protein